MTKQKVVLFIKDWKHWLGYKPQDSWLAEAFLVENRGNHACLLKTVCVGTEKLLEPFFR